MKKTLITIAAAILLGTCALTAEKVMEPLAEQEILSWHRERYNTVSFSRSGTDGTVQTCYQTADSAWPVHISTDGKKAWYQMKGDLYLLEGASGELKNLGEIQTPFIVTADDTLICFRNHDMYDIWGNTGKEAPFHFTVMDAETGVILDTVAWTLFNWGDECELYQTENPDCISIHYTPAGLFYAEAVLNVRTLELTVIRDDSHLSYDDLPKIYKEDQHP